MSTDALRYGSSERGELQLRSRACDGALELRVNGVFVMDTAQTVSERLLATAALDHVAGQRLRVLVGGLGLGFTLAELLRCERVAAVAVAEIEPELVGWHREGLIAATRGVLDDSRVEVIIADVAEALSALEPHSVDLILLDVDNGPDFLVYERNAQLYTQPLLQRCRRAMAPGAVTAVWSMNHSAALAAAMSDVFVHTERIPVPVSLAGRRDSYWLYLGSG